MEHGEPVIRDVQGANSSPGANSNEKDSMPITNVTKIMRRALPPKTRISEESKVMIQQCVSVFIRYINKTASSRCKSEFRKIEKAEDILWAMKTLGFHYYVILLSVFLQRFRSSEGNNPMGLMQGNGNGQGLGLGPRPLKPSVETSHPPSQPILPANVEIPQPSPPVPDAPLGSYFSKEQNPNSQLFDVEAYSESAFSNDIDFDEILNM